MPVLQLDPQLFRRHHSPEWLTIIDIYVKHYIKWGWFLLTNMLPKSIYRGTGEEGKDQRI